MKKELTCKNCKKRFEVEYNNIVDDNINKEDKTKFLNGDYFKFECPHCKKKLNYLVPCLYHNLDKSFFVKLDSLVENINFYLECKKNKYPYKLVACKNIDKAREAVRILENDLDYRLAIIYKYLITKKFSDSMSIHGHEFIKINSFICYEENELVIIYFCEEKDKGKHNYISKFDKKEYDKISKRYKDKLEGTCEWYFDENSAKKVVTYTKREKENLKRHKVELLLVEISNKLTIASYNYEFNHGKYKIGDEVIGFWDYLMFQGKVVGIFNEFNEFTLPFYLTNFATSLWKKEDLVISNEHVNDVFLNKVLFEKLKDFLEKRIDELPYVDLSIANVILPFNISNERQINADNMVLDVYLDTNIEKEKFVYKFDDVLKYAILNSYLSIQFNLNDEKIKFPITYLVLKYIPGGTIYNINKLQDVLKSLNAKERKYLGINKYKFLLASYLNEKITFNKKFKDEDDYLYYLADAINLLADIIMCNYF